MNNRKQALSDTQRALLLGIINEINDVLTKTPENINKIHAQLYKLNRLFLETAMRTGNFSAQDKAVLIKTRDVVEQLIHPLLEINDLNKKQLQRAIHGLEEVSKDIQEHTSSPRTPKR